MAQWKVTYTDGSTDVISEAMLNKLSEADVANATEFIPGAQSSVSRHKETAKAFATKAKSSVAQHKAETKYRAGDAYTTARSALSVPIGAVMGGLEYAKDRAFNEGSWATGNGDPVTKYMAEGMELGNKGEGATGLVANPTNFLRLARAATLPWQIGLSGLQGGAIGGLEAYEAGQDASAVGGIAPGAASAAKSTLLSAGLSAGLGTLGGLTRRYGGIKQYPHYDEILRKSTERGGTKQGTDAAIEDIMGSTSFPYTQGEVGAVIDDRLRRAGEGFNVAERAIPEYRAPVPVTPVAPVVQAPAQRLTYTNAADFRRDLARGLGMPSEPRLLSDAELTLQHQQRFPRSIDPEADVRRIADYAEAKRIADIQGDATVHQVLPQDVQSAMSKRQAGLEQSLREQKNKFGDLTPEEQDLLGSIGDVKDIKDLSKLRRQFASQYKPSANPDERAGQYADELFHDAIVRRMKEEPEYARSLLETGAEKQYATNALLSKYANMRVPVPTGLARYAPLLNTYVGPNLLYKAGRFMENKAPVLGNVLTSGLGWGRSLMAAPAAQDRTATH